VAAKRASGKGCITRTGGSHRLRIRTIRVQLLAEISAINAELLARRELS
jgi:hypothetical protein